MKKITNVVAVLSVVFVLWIMVSFVDINMHNSPFSPDYQDYSCWNFFTIFFGEVWHLSNFLQALLRSQIIYKKFFKIPIDKYFIMWYNVITVKETILNIKNERGSYYEKGKFLQVGSRNDYAHWL